MFSRQLGMTAKFRVWAGNTDLGVINIQLEVAEALNMNDITKGREGSLDKTWLWSLHPSALLGANLHFALVFPVSRTSQPDLYGPKLLAKMLCSGSLLCYHLLMGFWLLQTFSMQFGSRHVGEPPSTKPWPRAHLASPKSYLRCTKNFILIP